MIVNWINSAMGGLFAVLLWPFRSIGPLWGLAFISLLAGVLMLWIFGKVSNQTAIKRVKDKIAGNLIGMRLFSDDALVVVKLQGRIFADTAIYMKHALIPIVVMIVPLVFILAQLNLRFSVAPLRPGEPTLIKVKARAPEQVMEGIGLDVPEGVVVETAAVRIESQSEIAWRIRADKPGRYQLAVSTSEGTVQKELIVGEGWGAVSTLRTGKSLIEKILYPGEAPIGASPWIESVQIVYPPLAIPVFGWNMHWLVIFLILSIVFGFAFRGVLGVQI